ncbi:hypothetical protein Anas_04711 [Armadillidium nasatum]|uniref:Uncharacterized protein n=1 Tax=Armadillidium nasatum TaxID=96803 RepID=A0A5N5SL94_9CRUS|nr:hypothetical protein Anas_04711 [Armadillidium nasatum]
MDLVVLFLFQFLTFSESSLLPDLLPDTVLNLTVVLQDVVIPSACCQSSCPTSAPECQTCPPESMYEKCARIGALYCEADQKCYTPTKGPFALENATQTCLTNSTAYYPFYYYWFHDTLANISSCQYLGFSQRAGNATVRLFSSETCPFDGFLLFFCTVSVI